MHLSRYLQLKLVTKCHLHPQLPLQECRLLSRQKTGNGKSYHLLEDLILDRIDLDGDKITNLRVLLDTPRAKFLEF